MAMTSVATRAQILPLATAPSVRPSRRALQVIAKQNMPQQLAARSGMAAAAAAMLLTVTSHPARRVYVYGMHVCTPAKGVRVFPIVV